MYNYYQYCIKFYKCFFFCQTQQNLCFYASVMYLRTTAGSAFPEKSLFMNLTLLFPPGQGKRKCPKRFLAAALKVVSFSGFWSAFRESRYSKQPIRKTKQNKPKTPNKSQLPTPKPWLVIFLLLHFLLLDSEVMVHERKQTVPVTFIFCGEQGTLIPVNNWGEKNIFMANGWMLKKKSARD